MSVELKKTSNSEKKEFLMRYTDFVYFFDYLQTGNLTLVHPENWPDRNDAHFLKCYSESREVNTLALCFTSDIERHHRWEIGAAGVGGVSIKFDKELLLKHAEAAGIKHRKVIYRKVNEEHPNRIPKLEDLPFIKRQQFRDEDEFRLIYETRENEKTHSFHVPFAAISAVRLSPKLPKNVAKSLKKYISEMLKIDDIYKSTLYENPQFKALAKHAD